METSIQEKELRGNVCILHPLHFIAEFHMHLSVVVNSFYENV